MQRYTHALLASAVAAGLVACGGSSGSNSSTNPTPTPSTSPTPAPTPAPTACAETFVNCSGSTAFLVGAINKDFTLTANTNWVISGTVTVGEGNEQVANNAEAQALKDNGVTLTVEPGTDVRATGNGILVVTRGSKLNANGTRENPITFSSVDEDFDGLSEWGGVVLQGFALQFGAGNTGPCNQPGDIYCNLAGEGGVGFFGGTDDADNSGIIRYVRIAEGGLVAGPADEVNGLTLQGVGHGTTIEYVQVHNNLDDGVEWFGGTVNAKWLVLTGNDDDDIDFDEGWRGNVQYAIVAKSPNASPVGGNDPRGIEANSSDEDYVPQTNGALMNVTIIGNNVNNFDGGEPGMRLRGALTTAIGNSVVTGFDRGCVRIDNADTDGQGTIAFSNVLFENVFGDCTGGFYEPGRDGPADPETNSGAQSPITFDAALAVEQSFAVLNTATSVQAVDNGSGFAFDTTDYVGAVEPGTAAADAWWNGWIIPGSLPQ